MSAYGLVLVGGGLQNGLISLASLHRDPARSIAVVEAGETLGGNHTWSLHAADVPDAARPFMDGLMVARFDSYDVSFPGFARTVHAPYSVISSEQFARVVEERLRRAPACELLLSTLATSIDANGVTLRGGRVLRGDVVIDARGPGAARRGEPAGYQKFHGRELRTRKPHGLARPILMDANVAQLDGFRFFYVLPLASDRLLVEDTCFSRSPLLDLGATREAIAAYAMRFGDIVECVREESGVLPMPWSTGPSASNGSNGQDHGHGSPLRAGYAGGFFHPATGYSLPVALRLAMHVASHASDDMFGSEFEELVMRHERQARYARELNRLLFHCFAPSEMWNVFARFYRLPEAVLARFYALSLTRWDQARILLGRPPRGFSLTHALTASRMS
jgi:lycopene beta-cyclase